MKRREKMARSERGARAKKRNVLNENARKHLSTYYTKEEKLWTAIIRTERTQHTHTWNIISSQNFGDTITAIEDILYRSNESPIETKFIAFD